MSYKVIIPTAGLGSRLENLTKNINKSLISIDHKPVLGHQIKKFPNTCEFVIALGFKGQLVKEYLELVYPKNKFIFEFIKPFQGKGSGLGYTLSSCKTYLREPFIFLSCDTIVKEEIYPPTINWVGYSEKFISDSYRSIELDLEKVIDIKEKGINGHNLYPYIGLSGIKDFDYFWDISLEAEKEFRKIGESFALREIARNKKLLAKKFTWFDTGTLDNLSFARKNFCHENKYNILDKEGEQIWFDNGKVIKYSNDTNFIKDRVDRSKILNPFVPKIIKYHKNMYCYKKVKGEVLSEVINLEIFKELLDYGKTFWNVKELDPDKKIIFKKNCFDFYRIKTYQRINLFLKNLIKRFN